MSLLIFIFALSVIIIVHELGHFWAARRRGVLVEEFGLGYPPRIWGKKIGETTYSLNLLPFGGFVRILGELAGENIPGELKGRSLSEKNLKTRISVALGGVTMNLLLGVVIFSLVYTVLGIPRKTDKVKVIGVSPGSPAAEAGLQEGDWLMAVREKTSETKLRSMEELIGLMEERRGIPVDLLVARGEEEVLIQVTPRESPPEGEGPLGVVISNSEVWKPPFWQRPFLGTVEGFKEAYFWGKAVLSGLKDTLANLFRGETPKNITGPVGIYQVSSEIRKNSGFWGLLHFFGFFSVNLAVINFLPFPALDGSRFWFLVWEGVTKRKPNPRFELAINQLGMVILILLLLLITAGDVIRLRSGG